MPAKYQQAILKDRITRKTCGEAWVECESGHGLLCEVTLESHLWFATRLWFTRRNNRGKPSASNPKLQYPHYALLPNIESSFALHLCDNSILGTQLRH